MGLAFGKTIAFTYAVIVSVVANVVFDFVREPPRSQMPQPVTPAAVAITDGAGAAGASLPAPAMTTSAPVAAPHPPPGQPRRRRPAIAAGAGQRRPLLSEDLRMIDIAKASKYIDECWDGEIVPALVEYIRIPNKSPAFDPDWAAHGHMDEAVALFERWARARLSLLPGATLETVRLPGRTPVIVIDVPGEGGPGERRHRAALRPSRQAAGDDRLGRGLRPVDPTPRRRQALWPRRRR